MNTSGTFSSDGNALEVRFNGECIRIEPWGENALRARARPGGDVIEPHVSALLPQGEANSEIEIENERARLRHGRIEARVRLTRRFGADVPLEPVVVYCEAATGRVLLSEARSHFAGPPPRQFKAISSGSFQLEATFAAFDEERLMGLGQPQHGREDLKGTSTNLVQQNSHVTIPFVVSNRGYGFLWNNPATGRVDFATNITRWRADATPGLDYWITAGDTPADILSNYIRATGTPPVLPEWATGFWQCKLRYQSQQEVLDIAREYKRRGLPLACIVIDFFAWTRQGEWEFDPDEWPDPGRLVKELEKLGVKVAVSIWPTVGANSKYYAGMRNRGQLLRTERGVPAVIQFPDKEPAGVHFLTYYDAFNPDARNFHWSKVKAGYCDHGIHNFWLDACEPELRPAHAEHVRTYLGNGAEMLSAYPLVHAQRYAEGLKEEGADDAVLLCRSTWAGGQRYPVVLWSGDVESTWEDYRAQIAAGLHAAMSGIGWWTTDIGGFYGGHIQNPEFRELLVRWFEFGVFSPICRLHGLRVPNGVPFAAPDGEVDYGREIFQVFTTTGGDNEVWSYGPDVLVTLTKLLLLRERLRPYIFQTMREFSAAGTPPMRPMSYAYPDDANMHVSQGTYMFGSDFLVAPVVECGAAVREIRLPSGQDWVHVWSGIDFGGGGKASVPAPLGNPPVFCRKQSWQRHADLFATVSNSEGSAQMLHPNSKKVALGATDS